MIKLFILIMIKQSEHSELIIYICVYINSTQFFYEIIFNLNKNLLFNYSYYIRTAVSILNSCI